MIYCKQDKLHHPSSIDKSCGVSSIETTIQTIQIPLEEKSSQIKINQVDIGLDASDFPEPCCQHSQIPKMEKYNKTTGNDYKDQAVDAVLTTSSKSSEVKFLNPQEDSNFKEICDLIRQEIRKLSISVHLVPCSLCETRVIIGVRYKCCFCKDYNLCSQCEEKNYHSHVLLKLKYPEETYERGVARSRNELGVEKQTEIFIPAMRFK